MNNMRHLFQLGLFSGLCLILSGGAAHAQFWKSKPVIRTTVLRTAPKAGSMTAKSEVPASIATAPVTKAVSPVAKPEAPATKVVAPSATAADPASQRKKKEEKKTETVFKDRYRIDILAQLYLNELVANGQPVYKSHVPDKALPGLSFYQGVRLAADTLSTGGYHLDVYVHDISDPASSVSNLINNKKLDSSDLVIGAVASPQVAPLADFARKHKINFVSALSPSDGNVTDNPSFHLLQPTLQRHCEALRLAIARKVRKKTVIVYHRDKVALDDESFDLMTENESFKFDTISCNQLPDAGRLRALFDSTEVNYVVIPVLQTAYATELLQQLHNKFPQYSFEVFGMPSWKGMDALRKEGNLDNIGITVTAPYYFDASTSAGRGFAETYNRVYGGKAAELAFRGYEAMYWYAYLLMRYGTRFQEHYGDSGVAPFTRFDMKLLKDEEGNTRYFENSHVYKYRYQGGSFSVEQ